MKQRTASTAKASSPRIRPAGEIIAELKKVIWLNRNEAIRLTGMVLLVSVAMAILLGVIDLGFTKLVDTFFIG
ncbi:MAG: preprotein translocase subunit SecE [Chloroflexota bacterium]